MVWMPPGAPPYFIDAAPLTNGMIERRLNGIGYKPQGVQKIALARSGRPDKEGEPLERRVAESDALVVAYHYPSEEGGIHASRSFMFGRSYRIPHFIAIDKTRPTA